jgi:DNA-binding MarR family transcriptional regulator
MSELPTSQQVERFIREEIDSVPQLEALLLFWRRFPREWTCDQMARELYVSPDEAHTVLSSLLQRGLLARRAEEEERYVLVLESDERRNLMEALNSMYRNELVRVSKMIHANASPSLRDFARGFRFRKE